MAKVRKEPEVTIMGEEVNGHWKKHDSSGGVVWGFSLLFVGLVFLLNTLGILPWETWSTLLRLWPLLLILSGIRIILGDNFVSHLTVSILAFCLFGLIFLALIRNIYPEFVTPLPENIKILINVFSGMM